MARSDVNRLSPIPGLGLEGYADEMSVPAGKRLQLMLSGPPCEAQWRVVRLIHGDPNPSGPGYKEEPVDWGQPATVAIREQCTDLGSYVEVPHSDSLNPMAAFTLAMWFYPTLQPSGWHTLAAKWMPGQLSYALFYAGDRFLTAAISPDGQTAEWVTARETAHLHGWHFVAFSYDPHTGEARLYQRVGDTSGGAETRSSQDALVVSPKTLSRGRIFAGTAPLLFGAITETEHTDRHWAHFNGKIGHPVLVGEALDSERVWTLSEERDPARLEGALGCWDLSLDVSGSRVVDASGHGNHGKAVNAPGRAVTGPFWAGMPSRLFTEAPQDYNAVHFHDDDLEGAQWEPTYDVEVAADARPGIYAARVASDADELFVPFVVRPKEPRCSLACLVPTLTWQAYGSNRACYSYTEDGVLDRGLSLYNVHSDGSLVYYRTRHQPTRAWNPTAGFQHWGAHTVTANLYLIDWLEQKGFDYDVYADEDLHRQGEALLSRYLCIILGSHPEYCTREMVDALSQYTRDGGRVLYLGGNGLYWVTSIDADRPHLIEVRKGGEGDYGPTYVPQPGEWQHSTTGELGGLWARRGRPPRHTLGVEHSANVWTAAEGRWGFRRVEAGYKPEYRFIFEGVGRDEVIGDFGLNLGSAAGFEMDSVQEWQGDEDDSQPVVLAEARHDLFTPPRRTAVPPAAHLAFWSRPRGGAVLAAGSVTWTGSLSHNQYENNVSRITENVLRRFLETPSGSPVADQAE